MKRKYLIIMMVTTMLMTLVGCSDKTTSDEYKVLDSMVMDHDTKGTTNKNSKLDIKMISETEGISGTMYNGGSLIKEKIIYYTMVQDESENKESQFPKWYLETIKVGDITDEKDKETELNKINWQDKNIEGRVLQDFNNSGEIRIIKDNKGYKFNSKGELEEIDAYETFIDKYGDNQSTVSTYVDGTIDLFWIEENGQNKVVLIDTIENKYYEISEEALSTIEDRRLNILGIEDNKIYASLEATSTSPYMRDASSIIGYFEDDKFTTILSSDIGINVNIIGGAIYSKGRILFSGYAEDKNGVWNYDVNTKKLVRQIDVSDETLFYFNLNPTKNRIMLTGSNFESDNHRFSMNLATINENLEVSSLTNIVSSKTKSGIKGLQGWSEDGTEFYLYTTLPEKGDVVGGVIDISYEVYKIIN